MRIIIIGGGKIGSHLTLQLSRDGHAVTVIEVDEHKARVLGEDGSALVLAGDGTDIELLEEAGVRRAQWVVAVTGRDENNVVACQLALTLGAHRVLARLNDPRNRATFEALEIPVVGVTDLMAQIISREVEVEVEELVRIAFLGRGQLSLLEVLMPDDTDELVVKQLNLPESSILVTVVRGEEVLVPRGNTRLLAGDRVLAVTAVENEAELRKALVERSES